MSLLLLLRSHDDGDTPAPTVETRGGGEPAPLRRPAPPLRITGTADFIFEFSATTTVVFDVSVDDDDRFFL